MISYRPFWETLKASSESPYTLINKYRVSCATFDKVRKNKAITTTTLNDLCRILDCPVEKILEYIPNEKDQQL